MKTSGNYNNSEHSEYPEVKATRRLPDYFPGTTKPSVSAEHHHFFCAIACVQESLEVIPKAKTLFNAIIEDLKKPGCKKISSITHVGVMSYTNILGRMTTLYIEKKRYRLAMIRLAFLLKILSLLPSLILSKDLWNLLISVHSYIIEVFNRDPSNPRVKIGINTVVLSMAVVTAAQFSERNIDPYEHDQIHNPLRAEMALSRPRTREGRKLKTSYNKALRDLGFQKKFDKHYKYGAKKWLLARVICSTVTEAAMQLNMNWEQLYKDLVEFDKAMGYPRGK
jgi:hypothetical protein